MGTLLPCGTRYCVGFWWTAPPKYWLLLPSPQDQSWAPKARGVCSPPSWAQWEEGIELGLLPHIPGLTPQSPRQLPGAPRSQQGYPTPEGGLLAWKMELGPGGLAVTASFPKTWQAGPWGARGLLGTPRACPRAGVRVMQGHKASGVPGAGGGQSMGHTGQAHVDWA